MFTAIVFDEWFWDFPLFLLGCAALIYLYHWNKKRMIAKVQALIATYPVPGIENLIIQFWRDWPHGAGPTDAEVLLVQNAWGAAKRAWPDLAKQFAEIKYFIWIVREPGQPVGYRTYGGIAWADVPDVVLIPETSEHMGYGGMSDRGSKTGTMYVATFFPDRPPLALLAHEITHCVKPIHGHTSEFVAYERKLLAELGILSHSL